MPRAYGTTNAAPYAAAPAVGAAGDTYFNTTSKLMYLSDGVSWIAVQSGSTGTFDGFTRTAAGPGDIAVGSTVVFEPPLAVLIEQQGTTYPANGANTRFTIPASGVYNITGHMSAAAAGWPASTQMMLLLNGVVLSRSTTETTSAYQSMTVSVQRYLSAGDTVSMAIYAASATTIRYISASGGTDARQPFLAVWRAGTGPAGPTGPAGGLLGATGYYYGQATTISGVAAGALVPITWNSQGIINGFTPATAGSGATVAALIAGRYKVDAQITFANGATAIAFVVGRIEHYAASGLLLAQRDVVGPGVAANAYSDTALSGLFDMAVGDYVRIVVQPAQAGLLDSRTWIEITPVGGAKGDTGATGPDVTAAQSSYFYTNAVQAGGLAAGANTLVSWNAAYLNNGFTFTAPSSSITITRAGRYLVDAILTILTTAGSVNGSVTVRQLDSFSSIKATRDFVTDAAPAAATWAEWIGHALFDCAVGDIIQVLTNNATGTYTVDARSYLTIVPVGGVKGDAGPIGATGATGAGAGTGFVARGEWSNAVAYNPMEVVTKNGVAFLAMASNTNVDPGSLPAGSFAAISDLQASIAAIGKILPWTPVFRQGVTLSISIANAWYARVGEWVIGEFNIAFASSGTAAQPLQMDLPVLVRAVTGGANAQDIGSSFFYTGANNYMTLLATSVNFTQFASGSAYYSTQVVSGNQMTGFFMYPAPVGV